MPNIGVVSMVVIPVARRRNVLLCASCNPSSVVQDWPETGMNCRSSVQIGHAPGGASEGGYCVPQAVQMKAGMRQDTPILRSLAQSRAGDCRSVGHKPIHLIMFFIKH